MRVEGKIPLTLVTIAFSLSGCAAVWGGSYNIESQNSKKVVIDYDAGLTNSVRLQSVADNICEKYNKDAIPQDEGGGGIRTISFACVSRGDSPASAAERDAAEYNQQNFENKEDNLNAARTRASAMMLQSGAMQSRPYQAPVPTQTNCTSTKLGVQVQTNCQSY
ncbi:hypothetical protein [Kozakia baliensis]|uniref:hypothetical protein n=1 Tax=Kozakia baliensis TaxID=153496 RepID=UPI00126831B9|nr:hypothetical protein [Kozakia baliensis]